MRGEEASQGHHVPAVVGLPADSPRERSRVFLESRSRLSTDAVSQGTAIVGDFRRAALFDREAASVTVGTVGGRLHQEYREGARRGAGGIRRAPAECILDRRSSSVGNRSGPGPPCVDAGAEEMSQRDRAGDSRLGARPGCLVQLQHSEGPVPKMLAVHQETHAVDAKFR